MTKGFPLWDIGKVNGIETEYDVHWLGWDRAQISVEGEEVVTFSSANPLGFTDTEGVINEAADVVYAIENPLFEDDEW